VRIISRSDIKAKTSEVDSKIDILRGKIKELQVEREKLVKLAGRHKCGIKTFYMDKNCGRNLLIYGLSTMGYTLKQIRKRVNLTPARLDYIDRQVHNFIVWENRRHLERRKKCKLLRVFKTMGEF